VVYFNLGSALLAEGKLEEAADVFTEGLTLEPDYAQGWCDLGILRGRQGRVDEAIGHFRQALANDPDNASAHRNLGMSLQAKGRTEEAIGHYRQALLIMPNSAEVHYGLGMALAAAGQYAEALDNLRHVLEQRPDDPLVLNTIAWLLATIPDAGLRQPEEAIRLAEHAAGLTGHKAPEILDTLAAAYAAGGDYPRALAEAEVALGLARAGGALELAADIARRVDLYRQSRPYVGP
jgi:tetratricopeptide (TPR) repeat protein